jgi:hypothetical protein
MARIDKELALKMMQTGNTDSQIGAYFGTSRQAVNLLRKSFIKESKLDPKHNSSRIGHVEQHTPEFASKELSELKQVSDSPSVVETLNSKIYPSLEQLTDWMIHIIKEAGDVQQLRHRCELAETHNKALQIEVDKLKQDLQELTARLNGNLARFSEYQDAIRKLELPPANT